MDLLPTGPADSGLATRTELLQTLLADGVVVGGDTLNIYGKSQKVVVGLVDFTEADSSVCSPQSVSSSDSGQFSSLTDEDQFLAGLFGSDFPLSSDSPLSFTQDQAILPLIQVDNPLNSLQYSSMPEPKSDSSDSGIKIKLEEEKGVERSRKNAESARLNRIKKKQYVDGLEKERTTLKTENVILKTRCHELGQNVKKLQTEVDYLKSVLANESTLSALIQNIPSIPNVRLTSSFTRKRANPDSKCTLSTKRLKTAPNSGGVCLHVSQNDVSLEFCQHCSKQAVEGTTTS